jgi:beta-lactamase class A
MPDMIGFGAGSGPRSRLGARLGSRLGTRLGARLGSRRAVRLAAVLTLLACSLCVAASSASSVNPAPDTARRGPDHGQNGLLADTAVPVPAPSPPSPSPSSEPSMTATLTKADRRALSRELEKYLDKRTGRTSVSIRDLTTGVSYTYNGKHRPATASVVKMNIVMTLVLQARKERRRLTSGEKALAAQAIKVSDNKATDVLWGIVGGSAGLARANRRFGLRDTEPGPGGAWGATITSASDQVRLLAALVGTDGPLHASDRRYVLDLMSRVAPEQAWGVSAAGGKDAEVALKNGWLPRKADGGAWTVNSVGRVQDGGHDYLIAVLSDRHPSVGAGMEIVEHVARTVTAALAAPGSAA